MSGHTPGPWLSERIGGWWTIRPDGYAPPQGPSGVDAGIADAFGDNAEANARLIAAAPDLLEALEFALGYPSDEDDECVQKMRAAVVKARGESS